MAETTLQRLHREHGERMEQVIDALEREALPRATLEDAQAMRKMFERFRSAAGWETRAFVVGLVMGAVYTARLLPFKRWYELRMLSRYDEDAAIRAGAEIERVPPVPYDPY